jgi:serine/threonine protein kinase
MKAPESSYWVTDGRSSGPDGSINAQSENFADITIIADPPQGFFRLYRAKRYGRLHILKVLKPEYAENPVYLELIRKEFDIGYSLDHPNIRRTIGLEYVPEICGPDSRTASPCIVLEYVDGLPLSDLLSQGSLTDKQKDKIIAQVCDALTYIHSKQIVHRDLKPDNILITSNGQNVKLIDFGLSDTDDYCELKSPAGTRDYASPEQKAGMMLDSRSDIYSLGLIIRDITDKYPRTVAKCTRKNRDRRFSSAEEVLNATHSEVSTRHTLILASALLAALLLGIALTLAIRNANKPDFITVHDLSANGQYANCYVVSKPGRYKFATTLVDGTSIDYGDMAHWIWQSPTIIVKDLLYDSNYITFTVKDVGKGGNALITLEDSEGTRLWAWHIWVTPYGLDKMNVSLKGNDWLNCNLGATFVPPTKDSISISRISDEEIMRTYGLYYQYGRPTPFPGGNTKGSSAENFNTGFSAPNVLNNWYMGRYMILGFRTDTSLSIIDALRKPLTAFIRNTDQPYPFLFPAQSDSTVTSWGGHVVNETDPFFQPVPSAGKTNFDPCPAGYRVPSTTELYEDLNPGNKFTRTKNSKLISTSVDGTYSKMIMNDGKYILLPATGHLTANSDLAAMLVNVGYDCLYPTSDIQCIGTTPRKSTSPTLSSSSHTATDKDPVLYQNVAMYFYTRFFTSFSSDFLSLQPVRCVRNARAGKN